MEIAPIPIKADRMKSKFQILLNVLLYLIIFLEQVPAVIPLPALLTSLNQEGPDFCTKLLKVDYYHASLISHRISLNQLVSLSYHTEAFVLASSSPLLQYPCLPFSSLSPEHYKSLELHINQYEISLPYKCLCSGTQISRKLLLFHLRINCTFLLGLITFCIYVLQ